MNDFERRTHEKPAGVEGVNRHDDATMEKIEAYTAVYKQFVSKERKGKQKVEQNNEKFKTSRQQLNASKDALKSMKNSYHFEHLKFENDLFKMGHSKEEVTRIFNNIDVEARR